MLEWYLIVCVYVYAAYIDEIYDYIVGVRANVGIVDKVLVITVGFFTLPIAITIIVLLLWLKGYFI